MAAAGGGGVPGTKRRRANIANVGTGAKQSRPEEASIHGLSYLKIVLGCADSWHDFNSWRSPSPPGHDLTWLGKGGGYRIAALVPYLFSTTMSRIERPLLGIVSSEEIAAKIRDGLTDADKPEYGRPLVMKMLGKALNTTVLAGDYEDSVADMFEQAYPSVLPSASKRILTYYEFVGLTEDAVRALPPSINITKVPNLSRSKAEQDRFVRLLNIYLEKDPKDIGPTYFTFDASAVNARKLLLGASGCKALVTPANVADSGGTMTKNYLGTENMVIFPSDTDVMTCESNIFTRQDNVVTSFVDSGFSAAFQSGFKYVVTKDGAPHPFDYNGYNAGPPVNYLMNVIDYYARLATGSAPGDFHNFIKSDPTGLPIWNTPAGYGTDMEEYNRDTYGKLFFDFKRGGDQDACLAALNASKKLGSTVVMCTQDQLCALYARLIGVPCMFSWGNGVNVHRRHVVSVDVKVDPATIKKEECQIYINEYKYFMDRLRSGALSPALCTLKDMALKGRSAGKGFHLKVNNILLYQIYYICDVLLKFSTKELPMEELGMKFAEYKGVLEFSADDTRILEEGFKNKWLYSKLLEEFAEGRVSAILQKLMSCTEEKADGSVVFTDSVFLDAFGYSLENIVYLGNELYIFTTPDFVGNIPRGSLKEIIKPNPFGYYKTQIQTAFDVAIAPVIFADLKEYVEGRVTILTDPSALAINNQYDDAAASVKAVKKRGERGEMIAKTEIDAKFVACVESITAFVRGLLEEGARTETVVVGFNDFVGQPADATGCPSQKGGAWRDYAEQLIEMVSEIGQHVSTVMVNVAPWRFATYLSTTEPQAYTSFVKNRLGGDPSMSIESNVAEEYARIGSYYEALKKVLSDDTQLVEIMEKWANTWIGLYDSRNARSAEMKAIRLLFTILSPYRTYTCREHPFIKLLQKRGDAIGSALTDEEIISFMNGAGYGDPRITAAITLAILNEFQQERDIKRSFLLSGVVPIINNKAWSPPQAAAWSLDYIRNLIGVIMPTIDSNIDITRASAVELTEGVKAVHVGGARRTRNYRNRCTRKRCHRRTRRS